MLVASFHSWCEQSLMLIIFLGAFASYSIRKFASNHPETAKKGTRIIGGLILRHLKKW